MQNFNTSYKTPYILLSIRDFIETYKNLHPTCTHFQNLPFIGLPSEEKSVSSLVYPPTVVLPVYYHSGYLRGLAPLIEDGLSVHHNIHLAGVLLSY